MNSRNLLVAFELFLLPCVAIASTNKFLILNDLHYDPTYYTRQESCVDRVDPADLPKYSSFDCEPNWELIQNAVYNLQRKNSSPKFIIWLGDNTHHARNYSDTVLTPDLVAEVVANITQLLNTTFPGIPVLPVLGNHDYFPKDQLPAQSDSSSPFDPIYDDLGDIWADWIGSNDEIIRFKQAGYYSRLVDEDMKLRVMVLNNNLYLPKNKQTENMEDPGRQYAWVDSVLEHSRTAGEKVIFIIHVPLGFDENSEEKNFLRDADNDRLADVIRDYSDDVIIGVFSGHAHTDTFKLLYNEAGEPTNTIFLSPALSPWRTFWNYASRNPAFREVTYDDSTWSLEGISQMYLKLVEANENPDDIAVWHTEYTFGQAYGVTSVSPAKMHEVLQRFKEYGSDMFHSYYDYNTVSVQNGPCSCHCKSLHICAIEQVQRAPYRKCLEEQAAICGSYGLTASAVTVLLAVVAYFLLKW